MLSRGQFRQCILGQTLLGLGGASPKPIEGVVRPKPGEPFLESLPGLVDDQRYPPSSLKYVFALHNHPYEATLSDSDIRSIVSKGLTHGFEVETKTGKVRLAVIAFFSRSNDFGNPTCDGFFQYIPVTGQLLKWTHTRDEWLCEQTGTVRWLNEIDYRVESKMAPCRSAHEGAP